MTELIQRKQQAACADETKAYWVKVVPTLWASQASKKKALGVFKYQLQSKIVFKAKSSLVARIEALEEILGEGDTK